MSLMNGELVGALKTVVELGDGTAFVEYYKSKFEIERVRPKGFLNNGDPVKIAAAGLAVQELKNPGSNLEQAEAWGFVDTSTDMRDRAFWGRSNSVDRIVAGSIAGALNYVGANLNNGICFNGYRYYIEPEKYDEYKTSLDGDVAFVLWGVFDELYRDLNKSRKEIR